MGRRSTPHAGLSCSWNVRNPGNGPIEIAFFAFSTKAKLDFVNVYSSDGSRRTLVQNYSGSHIPAPLRTSQPNITIEFIAEQPDYTSTRRLGGFVASIRTLQTGETFPPTTDPQRWDPGSPQQHPCATLGCMQCDSHRRTQAASHSAGTTSNRAANVAV